MTEDLSRKCKKYPKRHPVVEHMSQPDIRHPILYHLPCWCHHKICMSGSVPVLKKKSCVKGVPFLRTAVMCLRGAALPESGWIFYTFFKVHRHFRVFSCIPTSVCQCHCPRRDVAWTVRMVTGIPWRAAVCRPSPGGTVTQNASSVRGRQITTTLLPLLPRQARGVAAPWRLDEEGRAPTSYHPP